MWCFLRWSLRQQRWSHTRHKKPPDSRWTVSRCLFSVSWVAKVLAQTSHIVVSPCFLAGGDGKPTVASVAQAAESPCNTASWCTFLCLPKWSFLLNRLLNTWQEKPPDWRWTDSQCLFRLPWVEKLWLQRLQAYISDSKGWAEPFFVRSSDDAIKRGMQSKWIQHPVLTCIFFHPQVWLPGEDWKQVIETNTRSIISHSDENNNEKRAWMTSSWIDFSRNNPPFQPARAHAPRSLSRPSLWRRPPYEPARASLTEQRSTTTTLRARARARSMVMARREGSTCLRSYGIARPMIWAIMTSLVNRSVKFQWPLKDDTRKVFHPIIAQRIWKKALNRPRE